MCEVFRDNTNCRSSVFRKASTSVKNKTKQKSKSKPNHVFGESLHPYTGRHLNQSKKSFFFFFLKELYMMVAFPLARGIHINNFEKQSCV